MDETDPLRKMRFFIDFLVRKFKSVYVPHDSVTVDESMVKFKGRLAFRQYLPSKPIKWGLKVWSLCESSTGYMANFQVYTGKHLGGSEHGLGHRVVMDLTQHLHGSNIQLYMDNFYTGVPLLSALRARFILACGTIRPNRKGLPTNLLPKNKALRKHEYVVAKKNNLVFCSWMDTKPVLTLSNFHQPESRGVVTRRDKGESARKKIQVPKQLEDYQTNMKGVDLCDQMVSYHLINHRSKKWWRRLYFYLQMVSVHNAYIVAKDCNEEEAADRWPQFQDFIEDLALELIGNVRAKKAPPTVHMPERGAALHEIQKLYSKKKTCRECSLRAGPKERRGVTEYGCRQCNEPVHQTKDCVSHHLKRHLQLQ